jgi:hypothetical protein
MGRMTSSGRSGGLAALVAFNLLLGLLGLCWNGGRLVILIWAREGGVRVGDRALAFDASDLDLAKAATDAALALMLAASAVGLSQRRLWGSAWAGGAAAGQIVSSIVEWGTLLRNAPETVGAEPAIAVGVSIARATALVLSILGAIYPIVVLIALARLRRSINDPRCSSEAAR